MDTIKQDYNEQSTFIRNDSLKSSSILRLTDVLCQHILLHPFVSLRRTCQVNRKCSPLICVQPFSLVPFIYHQQRKHGLTALYKGLSSELLVRGISLGTETALANYTDWPTSISSKRFIEDSLKVFALRGISVALCTPFLCSSVIETVQSVIVVKDRPSFIDCLRDGFLRLLHLRSTPSARMLPIWLLVIPTVLYHVAHSAIWHVAKKGVELCGPLFACSNKLSTVRHMRNTQRSRLKNSVIEDSTWQQQDLTIAYDTTETSIDGGDAIELDSRQISNSIIASLVADIALLPAETVLHSLYIQGTRTIIDNCDETTVVLPVLTNYDSLTDCYQSIIRFEGSLGLYKGLGAIILQYSIHFLLLRSLYYVLRELRPSGFDNLGNASQRPKAQQTEVKFRETMPSNQFDMLHFETNRHSTPKNVFDSNRFNQSDYRLGDTPEHFDQL